MSYDQDAVVDRTCVRFTMHFPDGPRQAAISAKALVEYFGADSNEASLLDSYRANFRTIHAVAQQMEARTLDNGILITEADLEAAGGKPGREQPARGGQPAGGEAPGGKAADAKRQTPSYMTPEGHSLVAGSGNTLGEGRTAGGTARHK